MTVMNDGILAASTKMKYKGEEVTISLFIPKKAFSDSDEYSCSFLIEGGEIKYSGESIGYDSMQSLILSLKTIGTFLSKNDELDFSAMEWDGGSMEFPLFENI